jgi:threonine dehydrogenase-like Zn-dependent dehydrogenase
MKALSLTGIGQAQITEIPEPARQSGDILLKVQMVGLCGSDLSSFRGRNEHLLPGTHVTVSPYTSCGICPSCRRGRENACRINQTFGVQRDGAITERIAVPAEKVYASNLPIKDLCLVEPLTVGFHAVRRGRVTKNDTVAVFGCGGVGLGAIAGSAFRGARTIAIDLDDAKLATAELAGATDLIHPGREDVRARLREITSGDGPDVMIEAIGLAETFQMAVEEVAFTGRVVYIGYAKELVSYETKLFVQKELDILGSRNALPEDFLDVMSMLQAGRFPVEQTISRIVSLKDSPAILAEWSAHPSAFTKIMVEIDR